MMINSIGVGAQSTLGGGARHFCRNNMYEKLTKCRILHDCCPKKCQNFYIRIAHKYFPDFLLGGGHVPPLHSRLLRLLTGFVPFEIYCCLRRSIGRRSGPPAQRSSSPLYMGRLTTIFTGKHLLCL